METAAFVALAMLGVVRLPALRQGGARSLSALALLAGAGALFMVGTIVPLSILDGWIGGSNVVNLLQNMLATLAIWFMTMTAKTMAAESFLVRRAAWELGIVMAAFATPFFLMHRGPTHADFVETYAADIWLWMYASIYMGYIACLMIRLSMALRGREPRPYAVVRLGAVLMGVASVIEIAYLTARVADLRPTPEWLGDMFIPLFYGGILLIALGLAWFPFACRTRRAALAIAMTMLRRASAQHSVRTSDIAHYSAETITHDTYRLAVQLADLGNVVELTRTEHLTLRLATYLLDTQVPAPRMLSISASPEVVL